ncbi:MAG: methylenetetrahydrofolate--tRNA-(uracil(54)-C(5))-methyltransferase (FADH(2)-oxidizing) TrmFO [Clostridiales bacterium]|nr:methylenetetrahydrofolate--tRNA-(uracil(54)-C(5))-methyltransferase (FADH(2)-oxidizing) TrmFO [Clostridiales bacterium]
MIVNIIGGGLAGCEASYQLLKRGFSVNMYEMKPKKFSPAHKLNTLAELVCSNSLKSNDVTTSEGLLKQELRMLDSLLIKIADKVAVPAGSALAVDRNEFSIAVTNELLKYDNFKIIEGEVTDIDLSKPTIIATGPLTSDTLSKRIAELVGEESLYFFDAIAPIVAYDTIDFDSAFIQDRYNKGTGDYINCPLNKEEYDNFYNALISAETVELKDFENKKVFEGCMPIEILAKRGYDTMRFGPLKPVGLTDKMGKTPYAVIQLRRETREYDFYNMVGFQTNLKFGEQKRVFSLIPALKNAEFLRYGTMHKNTYINAPKVLTRNFQLLSYPNVFIAGQLSGVEGYVESIFGGLICGINMCNLLQNKPMVDLPIETICGALQNYIATTSPSNFQPMSANMGLINNLGYKVKDKKEKYKILSDRSLDLLAKYIQEGDINDRI